KGRWVKGNDEFRVVPTASSATASGCWRSDDAHEVVVEAGERADGCVDAGGVLIRVEPGHAASGLGVFPDRLVDLVGGLGVVGPGGFQVRWREVRVVFEDAGVGKPETLPLDQAGDGGAGGGVDG